MFVLFIDIKLAITSTFGDNRNLQDLRIREECERLIEGLRNFAVTVGPQQKLSVVDADESNNRYIECAVESGPNYVVMGGSHLLTANEYRHRHNNRDNLSGFAKHARIREEDYRILMANSSRRQQHV